uniref:Serpentine Receptor, class H n=1 Tax=Caenorhabditis tropicalis TaxID=1561998 RepID=A0A1I7UBB9_9PELO
MCSISLEIDERHFYIVENFKPMSQIITMLLVNFVSIGVNLVMFYVTILNSKNESTLYRLVSFIHNFSLFLAQFYWGFILNPIPLLPLPGVQSIGVLRGTVSTFMLLVTWIFLFAVSIFMMYMIMLIRLRVLARRGHIFHLRNSTYFLIFLIIFTLVFFPILSRILPFYQSEEAMKNHLLQYYPKCVSLANHPGFFVFVNTCQSKKGVFVVLILLFGGASLYLVVCAIIIYEIKMQSYAWNVNKTKNHIKVLKHTIVQNIFRFLFLAIAPAIVLRNTFLPSEADTINITLFANAMFTAAPIPCAIVILTQNTTYRNFLLSRIYCFNRRAPSSSDSGSSRSSAPSTVFRQTTVL